MACYVILINNDCYTVFLQEATVTGLCILPQWRMCLSVKKKMEDYLEVTLFMPRCESSTFSVSSCFAAALPLLPRFLSTPESRTCYFSNHLLSCRI